MYNVVEAEEGFSVVKKPNRVVPSIMIFTGVLVIVWSVWLLLTADVMNDQLFLYAPVFCWYAVLFIIWGVVDLSKKPETYRYK